MGTLRKISFFSYLTFACFLFSCSENLNVPKESACNGSQKIRIYKEFVYDLSGFEGSSKSSPFNLFDENEHLDPKNGVTSEAVTNAQPALRAGIYYSLNRGNRIVIDLRAAHKVSDVYLYDRSTEPDSIWIYSGNMPNMKLKVAFTGKGDPAFWGWRKFTVNDSTQFLMIRFSSPAARINEMVLYGCPYGNVPHPPVRSYTGPRFPSKTLKEFLGVNMYINIPAEWTKPFSSVRMYTIANTFDMDTVNPYPNNKISIGRYGYLYQGNSFRHYSDDLQAEGKSIWYSVRGVPVWMNKLNMWDHDRPVTRIGMDTEDPLSYGRHSNLMWTLAAVFGKTKVDTNELNIADMIRVTGKGTMTVFENGNEEDAFWAGNRYCSPMEYFAQSSADYDGHEGKLGPKHGIKVADTNSKLMMSGMIEFDTARLKVLDFLSRHLRSDKKFIWQGGVQFHHYSTELKDKSIFNRNKTTVAITPEEDSLRSKLAKVRDFVYRIQPGVECILGEYGYDKAKRSPQAAPIVPGYTGAQSQGIMLLRGINAAAFSGFDKCMIYWMKDDVDENNPSIYLTSGLVRQMADGKIVPYPSWFYVSTLINRLGDYVPDEIVSEKGEVWIYTYRNKSNPDSLVYFVYSPTRTGKKFSFDLKLHEGASASRLVEFAENSTVGKESILQINNNFVKLEITEVPRLLFVASGSR